MRPRIFPEYYITTNDGIRTQIDKYHFFNELTEYFPNPKEVLSKLENEDVGISAGDKHFFVIKK